MEERRKKENGREEKERKNKNKREIKRRRRASKEALKTFQDDAEAEMFAAQKK